MFPESTPCFWWGQCCLSYVYVVFVSVLDLLPMLYVALECVHGLRRGIRVAHLCLYLCVVLVSVFDLLPLFCVSLEFVRPWF